MDGSNNVRCEVTWQVLGDPFVELEVSCEDCADKEKLHQVVNEILALINSLEGRTFTSSNKTKTQYCMEIIFQSDENKRVFLGKLPTVQ